MTVICHMAFNTIDGMWKECLQLLLNYGTEVHSRVGTTTELCGVQLTLLDPAMNRLTHPTRRLSMTYAAAELLWYLGYDNKTAWLKQFAPSYEKFEDLPGEANGAYGARMIRDGVNQLQHVIHELKTSPNSRRAMISLYDHRDIAQLQSKDIPCTLNLQFLLRDGLLNLITTMRSNDVWLGFPYDVFCFTNIQQIMACELGVGVGVYVHQVGSMHLYDKNHEGACFVEDDDTEYESGLTPCDGDSFSEMTGLYLSFLDKKPLNTVGLMAEDLKTRLAWELKL